MTENSVDAGTWETAEETPAWLAAQRAGEPEPAAAQSAAAAGSATEPDPAPAGPELAAEPELAPVSEAATVRSSDAAPTDGVRKAAVPDVLEAMKDVVDPELGINVVDLGLVYGTFVDDDNTVTIDMTLTSAACPLTDVIEDQTRQALCTGPGGGLANDVKINWVWLPPWGPDKITDDGREQLRALGFNV